MGKKCKARRQGKRDRGITEREEGEKNGNRSQRKEGWRE